MIATLPDPRRGARLAAYAVAGVIALAGVLAVWGWLADPFGWRGHQLRNAQTGQARAEGSAAQAGAQAAAGMDAAAVVDRGVVRERETLTIRETNRETIHAQPGAGDRLPGAVLRAARRGLCDYAAYRDDPACVELRGTDPVQLPKPGGADALAGG